LQKDRDINGLEMQSTLSVVYMSCIQQRKVLAQNQWPYPLNGALLRHRDVAGKYHTLRSVCVHAVQYSLWNVK
jgi:predicted secreted protein